METTIHLGNLVSVKDLDITDRLADEDLYIDAIDEAIAEIKRLRYRIIELEAAQQSVHLTVLPVREIETVCPHCSLVFDVPVPEPHSK